MRSRADSTEHGPPRPAPPARLDLRSLDWANPERRIGLGALVLSALYALSGLPGAVLGLIVALALLLYFGAWLVNAALFIDGRIAATLGHNRGWRVYTKYYPLYKFVDIYRGAQALAAQHPGSVELHSAHMFSLGTILNGLRGTTNRRLNSPMFIARKIGYEQESFIPSDTFWLIRSRPGAPQSASVIRVQLPARNSYVHLEVAALRPDDAARMLEEIAALASANSIYRNRTIRVVLTPEVRSDYREDESMEPMDLIFYKEEQIADADIILEDTLRSIIERAVIDFHERRAELMRLGLPGKRGVLFYGPPGTGKTYTCKYIAHQLTTATTIVVTGHALLHMKAICAIAKMLQPALVLLEDVDLVFANREGNAYTTVLGEFIDQLDGFGEHDHVIFILTTNAIERIEPAIKDRPGRVSQCLYFGPPSATLRRRYLETLLRPYDAAAVNLQQIVGQTEGVSQAFLKELVFRAIQVASAATTDDQGPLRLSDAHLDTALHEMTSGSGRDAQRIIGFRVDVDR